MTNDFFNHFLRDFCNRILVIGINVSKMFVNVGFDSIHFFFAFHFIGCKNSRLHGVFTVCMNSFYDVSRRFFFYKFLFGDADFVQETELEFDDFLDFFMSKHDGIEYVCFRYLFGAAFYHQNSVFGAGNDNIHITLFALGYSRVDNKLSVNAADADTGNRAGKGNMGHAQGNRRANHSGNFRSIVMVYAKIIGYDMDVVTIGFGEQRANRAVNQAGKQRC